jgi:hypothetical protein
MARFATAANSSSTAMPMLLLVASIGVLPGLSRPSQQFSFWLKFAL